MIFDPPHSLASRAKPKRALIGLTPLIDVVFILLVFFMLVSSFTQWRTITLSPQQTTSGWSEGLVGAVLIEMRGEGDVRLSGETMRLDGIEDRVRALLDVAPDRRFLIEAGEGVALQDLVDLLDRLSVAGSGNVAFVRAEGVE